MSAEETTKNFWEAWNNFVWPEIKTVSYRLYYHADGSPDFYTMEDLPGQWIEVSQQVYVSSPRNVRVIDGELRFIPVTKRFQKLQPNKESGIRCDIRDICLVIDQQSSGTLWKLEENETH